MALAAIKVAAQIRPEGTTLGTEDVDEDPGFGPDPVSLGIRFTSVGQQPVQARFPSTRDL